MSKKDFYIINLILFLIYCSYQVSVLENKFLSEISSLDIIESEISEEEKAESNEKEKTDFRKLFLKTALKEEGYQEEAGNYTKYGAWYGLPNSEWCAMYVSWVAKESGINNETIPKFASVSAGKAAFQTLGAYEPKADYLPRPGDIIFFLNNASHTGIVLGVEDGRVYTIEGNSADMIARRNYSLDDATITGYGIPDFKNN